MTDTLIPAAEPPRTAATTGRPRGKSGNPRRLSPLHTVLLLLSPMLILFLIGFVLPLGNVVRFSFDEFADSIQVSAWSLNQFHEVFSNGLYRELILRTFGLGFMTTLISIVLCYPLGLAITRGPRALRGVLMAVVMTPMMVSVVVKTFGWTVLMSGEGVLQKTLDFLHIDVQLLFTPVGVTIGLVHTYMPFMALSLITALSVVDRRTEEAGRSLGSSPVGVFFRITLPQTTHGLVAGSVLTFVMSMSALVTPQLLGGGRVSTIVTVIYDQATGAQNWPLASALGVVLLAATFLILSFQTLAVRRATKD